MATSNRINWREKIVGLICAATHYFLAYQIGYSNPAIVWLAMPAVSVFHFLLIGKKRKSSATPIFMGRVMQGIWGALFLVIVALIIGSLHVGWQATYPVFMLFYGAACYTTGKAIQFNVLVWGGIASIVCGTVAFFLPFQYQLLLLMLAIVVSYILPAHLMKKSPA